jgi:hypothetical protein
MLTDRIRLFKALDNQLNAAGNPKNKTRCGETVNQNAEDDSKKACSSQRALTQLLPRINRMQMRE